MHKAVWWDIAWYSKNHEYMHHVKAGWLTCLRIVITYESANLFPAGIKMFCLIGHRIIHTHTRPTWCLQPRQFCARTTAHEDQILRRVLLSAPGLDDSRQVPDRKLKRELHNRDHHGQKHIPPSSTGDEENRTSSLLNIIRCVKPEIEGNIPQKACVRFGPFPQSLLPAARKL